MHACADPSRRRATSGRSALAYTRWCKMFAVPYSSKERWRAEPEPAQTPRRIPRLRAGHGARTEGEPTGPPLVRDALGELKRDPNLGHPLRGRLTGLRFYRVGVYRIIYELRDDKTLRIVAVRHRGDAYGADPR